MGKPGGAYGSGNTGLPQVFSGGKKTQNNQKSIFGAKNKSSVTDIRRMLARDDRNGQTQVANSWGQDSIVTSTLSYSESLRDQRQQTKNTTLALKKLKYQLKVFRRRYCGARPPRRRSRQPDRREERSCA